MTSPPQMDRGFTFESETDTEVIPKLMQYLYDTQVHGKECNWWWVLDVVMFLVCDVIMM